MMLATQAAAATRCSRCATPTTAAVSARSRITGNRGWSATSLRPVNVSYVQGGYRYRSPFRDLSDDDYIAACVADLRDVIQTTTAGDVACMIAEPIQGVGGFTSPPDGLFRAVQGSPRRARHPADLRRGADRLGPHRRALLGHPGARRHTGHDDLRQGPRQRPGHRRCGGARRPDGQPHAPTRSPPSAATRWPPRARTPPWTTCWTRPAGQRGQAGRPDDRRAARRRRRAPDRRRRARQGPDDRRGAGRPGGTDSRARPPRRRCRRRPGSAAC